MQFLLLHMLGHCAYLANTIDSIWFLNISIEPNPKLPINIGRSFLFCSFGRPLIVCMVLFFAANTFGSFKWMFNTFAQMKIIAWHMVDSFTNRRQSLLQ